VCVYATDEVLFRCVYYRYGSWDQVRNSVRRCERFRFDFYLQSCSADALGKR
jgi:hypothetical protein